MTRFNQTIKALAFAAGMMTTPATSQDQATSGTSSSGASEQSSVASSTAVTSASSTSDQRPVDYTIITNQDGVFVIGWDEKFEVDASATSAAYLPSPYWMTDASNGTVIMRDVRGKGYLLALCDGEDALISARLYNVANPLQAAQDVYGLLKKYSHDICTEKGFSRETVLDLVKQVFPVVRAQHKHPVLTHSLQ